MFKKEKIEGSTSNGGLLLRLDTRPNAILTEEQDIHFEFNPVRTLFFNVSRLQPWRKSSQKRKINSLLTTPSIIYKSPLRRVDRFEPRKGVILHVRSPKKARKFFLLPPGTGSRVQSITRLSVRLRSTTQWSPCLTQVSNRKYLMRILALPFEFFMLKHHHIIKNTLKSSRETWRIGYLILLLLSTYESSRKALNSFRR